MDVIYFSDEEMISKFVTKNSGKKNVMCYTGVLRGSSMKQFYFLKKFQHLSYFLIFKNLKFAVIPFPF